MGCCASNAGSLDRPTGKVVANRNEPKLKLRKEFLDFEGPVSLIGEIEKDDDDEFQLVVSKKEALSPDTYLFELEFPDPDWITGLWPAGHFFICAEIDGEKVMRPYTPITSVAEKGRIQFVIKVYRDCRQFPDGGKLTQHLEQAVNVGDLLSLKGPLGWLKYFG